MPLERLRPLGAGLARGDAQVDELARAEQAAVRVGGEERVPAKMLLDDEHLAFVAAGAARRGANRIRGLDGRQRFVAVNHVQRLQRPREVRAEVGRTQLHADALLYAGFLAACSRRTSCWTASVCISFRSRCSCVSRASTSLSLNE